MGRKAQRGVFHNVTFSRADCRLADFSQAIFINCHFIGGNFLGAHFSGARLEKVNFYHSVFSQPDILCADIIAPKCIEQAVFYYRGEWKMSLKDAINARKQAIYRDQPIHNQRNFILEKRLKSTA